MSIYSQVVIKDEIILYETENPDEENLTMPFYGKVQGTVPWGSVYWNHFRRVEIEADGQIVARGCPCNGCGYFNGNWVINNLPAATPVIVRAYTHCVNGEFVEGETRLINTGTNEYSIEVFSYNFQMWTQATTLKITSVTPPGNCPNAGGNYCDSSSWVQVPVVELAPDPNSTVIANLCSKSQKIMAAFSPATDHRTNLYDLDESNVIACYNQTFQTWQFNLDQNVKTYYQIGICSTNVSNNNLTFINDTLSVDSIPSNKCQIALKSFEAHKEYKYDIINKEFGLEIPDGGYLLKEVILEHENQHKLLYEKFMNDYLFLWEFNINTFRAICSTYIDIFEAEKGGKQMYWEAFFGKNPLPQFYAKFNSEYRKFTGKSPENKIRQARNEQRANNKPEVQNLIEKYIKKLKTHCGIS